MGNRFVDNVIILSTVLLGNANVYNKLFDDEQIAVPEVQTQWWSVVGIFVADSAVLLKFCAKYNGDPPLVLRSCVGLRLIIFVVIISGYS